MEKLKIVLALIFIFTLGACNQSDLSSSQSRRPKTELDGPIVTRDLKEIAKEGKLRAIMIYSSTSYFLYRGQAMGLEYELVKRLADHLGLELEIVLASNIDEVFDLLNRGEGDIITYGLTITEPRKELINFTDYLYTTHQALVQRKPSNWRKMARHKVSKYLVKDVIELIDDTVHLHRKSSYYERMLNLQEEIGGQIYLDTVVGDHNIEDLIKMVVDGKIKYTISDYNLASINQTYYPILDVETPVSLSQRIAWGTRNNGPEFLNTVNQWIKTLRKTDAYHFIYDKYYVHKKSYKRRIDSEFYSKNSGQISQFDTLVQHYSSILGWDWRLVSSVLYQESRFDPKATSWAGAGGLMQVMPSTASDLGLNDVYSPNQNVEAGTRYLRDIWEKFAHIPDSNQRIKFTLASYNCGYGHLLDAQRLSSKDGKDSLQFDENVAPWLRKMGEYRHYSDPLVRYGPVRGEGPFRYVRDIFLRYEHYKRLIPLDTISIVNQEEAIIDSL
jgi:membrane-bound lytic murein transglycosylase F